MKKSIVAALALLIMANAGAVAAEPANNPAFNIHRFVKRYMYATLTSQSVPDIRMGTQQPFLPFAVLEDPPALFLNFEVAPGKEADLIEYLDLPSGFALTPIAILEGESPRLYLTLNVYSVYGLRGLLAGNRAEWSVYVTKDGGRPSFMLVDAKASKRTLDPVDGFTPPTDIRHDRSDDGLRSAVAPDSGTQFRSLVTQSGLQNAERVYTEVAWVSANDRIYWRNGVADRTYYDGNFVDTPVRSVDPGEVTITNHTVWREFVHPHPANVLVYETGFELVISPWYNLDPE